MQGLYVTARDREFYLQQRPDQEYHDLDQRISDALDQQDDWVLEQLETTKLPDGYAQSASHQEVDHIDFDDPAIDHEFVLKPGEDILHECIRRYWQILCGDKGIRGGTHLVRGDDNRKSLL